MALAKLAVLLKGVKVNQNVYLELLCDYLPDSCQLTAAHLYQHDSAPPYEAKSVIMWMNDCAIPS